MRSRQRRKQPHPKSWISQCQGASASLDSELSALQALPESAIKPAAFRLKRRYCRPTSLKPCVFTLSQEILAPTGQAAQTARAISHSLALSHAAIAALCDTTFAGKEFGMLGGPAILRVPPDPGKCGRKYTACTGLQAALSYGCTATPIEIDI